MGGSDRNAPGHLPRLLVIGATKCGTTSLHRYLDLHPDIFMSKTKELRFFSDEFNWHRGLDWYRAQFTVDAKVHGESSPIYTRDPHHTEIPERIARLLPGVRLIYLVRDPVERAVSHYYDQIDHCKEARPLNQAMREALAGDDRLGYLSKGRYAWQIQPYLPLFPAERLLFLTTEALFADRSGTLRRVFSFLGVDADFDSRQFAVAHNPRRGKRRKNRFGLILKRLGNSALARTLFPSDTWRERMGVIVLQPFSRPIERQVLDEDLRLRLADYFREDAVEFQRLSGLDLSHWSVFGTPRA